MKKRMLCAVIGTLCLLLLGCAPQKEPAGEPAGGQAQTANPIQPVEDAEAFVAIGVSLPLPVGGREAVYGIIGGQTAEIGFTMDGAPYVLRGSAALSGTELHGVYVPFAEQAQGLCLDGENYGVCFTVARAASGSGALWTWDDGGVHYSLWAPEETADDAADSGACAAVMGWLDARYGTDAAPSER